MADHPILFSAPMVRALLDGRKTQTRRVIKPQPVLDENGRSWRWDGRNGSFVGAMGTHFPDFPATAIRHSRIKAGDRLWVREEWSGDFASHSIKPSERHPSDCLWFWADGNPDDGDWERPRPSVHMPRWASRLTLTITDVRVERLQDISEADAVAEGIAEFPCLGPNRGPDATFWTAGDGTKADGAALSARLAFRNLWESINGESAWEANPWVAAYTFTVERKNIDEVPA